MSSLSKERADASTLQMADIEKHSGLQIFYEPHNTEKLLTIN